MPHSFAALLVHVVFSTKNRACNLSPQFAARLFPYGSMAYDMRDLMGLRPAFRPVPGLGIANTLFLTAHAVGYDLSPFGLGKCENIQYLNCTKLSQLHPVQHPVNRNTRYADIQPDGQRPFRNLAMQFDAACPTAA